MPEQDRDDQHPAHDDAQRERNRGRQHRLLPIGAPPWQHGAQYRHGNGEHLEEVAEHHAVGVAEQHQHPTAISEGMIAWSSETSAIEKPRVNITGSVMRAVCDSNTTVTSFERRHRKYRACLAVASGGRSATDDFVSVACDPSFFFAHHRVEPATSAPSHAAMSVGGNSKHCLSGS